MKKVKLFRDFYLTTISFICGLMFIVQCGGGAGAIAEAISDALDINYDNSVSAISATTVNGAIDELDARFPMVKDKNNNVVGVLFELGTTWKIWDPQKKIIKAINPASGEHEILVDGSWARIYYTNDDCTGKAYISTGSTSTYNYTSFFKNGDLYYYLNLNSGNNITQKYQGYLEDAPQELKSYKTAEDSSLCNLAQTENSNLIKNVYTQSEEVFVEITFVDPSEIVDYEGPLHLGN